MPRHAQPGSHALEAIRPPSASPSQRPKILRNLRSPAIAIGWEIWSRSRAGMILVAVILGVGWIVVATLRVYDPWIGLANAIGTTLTGIALAITLGCFHFTEGSKRGGFGSFPIRLFNLPMTTRSLVALPMIYGAAAIMAVYVLCAALLFGDVEGDRPMLWPCLYLVFGLTQFQMILWSLPESRYLKVLCLGSAASVVTFGWMFLAPHIVAGALSEWGYAGSSDVFMRWLLVGLALTGPVAYGISLVRVRQQRHGRTFRASVLARVRDRFIGLSARARVPFRSVDQAIFRQEWRRTGFILPIVVVLIMALTCVPAWLSGGLSGRGTMGMLSWFLAAPFLFAMVLGRGFGKPDFWSSNLRITPFHAIRPVTPGQWVGARLKVALASAALTWFLVLYLAFIWIALVGDLHGPEVWLKRVRFYYSPVERWLMGFLALPAAVILTWRCLVASLAAGLSGSKLWYGLVNLMAGLGLASLFILILWRSGRDDIQGHLAQLWPVIARLPWGLVGAVIVKVAVAVWIWNQALNLRMISPRSVAKYFGCWLMAVGILMAGIFILCRNTHWLRDLLMLMALVIVPLARPGLAILSLARNRSTA